MNPPADPWDRDAPPGDWRADAAIAAALFALFAALRPAFPDGDGSGYAAEAIARPLFNPGGTKHVFYETALRLVYLGCTGLGLRPHLLTALTLVSNVAGAALYLILARGLYPPLLVGVGLSRACALGVMMSFGVMAAAATIEGYAASVALAAATVALALRGGFDSAGRGALVGVLFVLAVGFHVSNVLLLPLLLAMAALRGNWRPAAACAAVIAAGPVAVLAGPYLNAAPGTGLLDLMPRGDPQPPLAVTTRLAQAAYGVLRTAAWLPPLRELSTPHAVGYAAAALSVLALLGLMARRAGPPPRGLVAYLLLLAVPFAALGIGYYPSDPERWLTLVPAAWLLVGRVWDRGWPWLIVLALTLGAYNLAVKLLPDAREHPEVEGVRALVDVAGPGDVVVTPTGFGLIDEFALGRPLPFDILALDRQMMQHKNEPEACEAGLRRRLDAATGGGHTVFVFGVMEEGLEAGRGYPWGFAITWGYTPERWERLLTEYRPTPVREPTRARRGIYRLEGR